MADDKKDRVFVGAPSPDGVYPCIRKSADGTLSTGVIATEGTVEGAKSEVKLAHIRDNEFEIHEETALPRSGPPQVASKAYRNNWEGIFGKNTVVGQA